jgi:hypothetical protein
MVHYHTKLKGQAVTRALLPTPSDDDLNAGTLLSPEGPKGSVGIGEIMGSILAQQSHRLDMLHRRPVDPWSVFHHRLLNRHI